MSRSQPSPHFWHHLRDGLLETVFFTQFLGLIASLVLLIYGQTGGAGEVVAISFIFANLMSLSVKLLAAAGYSCFYSGHQSQKFIRFLIWLGALTIGTFFGSEIAIGLSVLLFRSWFPPPFTGANFTLLGANFLMIVSLFILTYVYISKKKRLEEKILENERIKHLRTQTQLAALQAKINPHFLFNTLNTMLNLISKAPDKVETMIMNLSDIYRKVLQYPEDQKIPLKDEIQLIKEYLEIEKIRIGSRLSYQISVDPDLENCLLPPLLIEPVVENAVIHGISPKPEGGKISLDIKKENNKICISVSDNGVGLHQDDPKSGFGLYSVKERMQLIYKDKAEFKIISSPQGGVKVIMEIPHEN